LLLAMAVLCLSSMFYVLRDLPDPRLLVERSSVATTKLYDRHGELLFEVLDPRSGRRTPISLADMPPFLPAAVVAVEDAGFWHHRGVEPRGLLRAAWQAAREGRVVSGGSTIPMQLARAVLLSPGERAQRSMVRKLREIALALAISRHFDKAEILELYLNEVYFGQLAYGVDAAARVFFGKPAHELDLAESAMLAGQVQAPAHTNPFVDVDAALARQRSVLSRMAGLGWITEQEQQLAAAEPLHLAAGELPMAAPHFTSWVLARLESELGRERLSAGGLHVITSLDLHLQRAAEQAIDAHLGALAKPAPDRPDLRVGDAALVALDSLSGDVLAMVGSADYFDGEIDGAVNVALARRQPGSALKPLIYAAAFDSERWGSARARSGLDDRPPLPFTPATVLADVPTSFLTKEGEPYRPHNYDRTWHGPIALRRALATSSNMVAVKVLEHIGLDAALDTAAAMGITTLVDRDRYGLALALGGGEVRLLELTGAYATLASGGRKVSANPILGVLDEADFARASLDLPGWRAAQRGAPGARVLDARAAWLVTDILSDDHARLPAFGERGPLALNRPAAAKTGTTTNFRDNWTLGYTPQLTSGVWVGNADGTPMRNVSGITGAAPIWHSFMMAAHRGLPVRAFARPEGLVDREICAASGLLAQSDCPLRAIETFIAGTEPLVVDDTHVALGIDASTGALWTSGCRGPRLRRVLRLFPPEATAWAAAQGRPLPPPIDCLGRAAVPGPKGDAVAAHVDAIAPTASGAAATAAGRPSIEIVQPAQGTVFALSDGLPRDSQRTPLEVRVHDRVALRSLSLSIDGSPIAKLDAPPWRTDWPLRAGTHELRAVAIAADGRQLHSPPLHFTVLEEDVRASTGP
jgi:penicillin-binding protein 1C